MFMRSQESPTGVMPQCQEAGPHRIYLMKHMKNRKFATVAIMSAFVFSLLAAGCARTVSRTETTRVSSSGTVKSKQETVTENPDGTVTKRETSKTIRP